MILNIELNYLKFIYFLSGNFRDFFEKSSSSQSAFVIFKKKRIDIKVKIQQFSIVNYTIIIPYLFIIFPKMNNAPVIDTAESLHSKFLDFPSSFTGNFGDTKDFHKGLEYFIGLPNPNVKESIRNEHLFSADSNILFSTHRTNDKIYKPSQEYELVISPDFNIVYPNSSTEKDAGGSAATGGIRNIKLLQEFLDNDICKIAQLLEEEVVALRLYTGPMFSKYNAVLRGFPTDVVNQLYGNKYVTTLHTIVSGIIKLSQHLVLPIDRKVYRGLGGMLLPDKFWKIDQYGCKGGVDYGMISTTQNYKIALEYSGQDLTNYLNKINNNFSTSTTTTTTTTSPDKDTTPCATLFEIELDQINRGASLKWLSQYPCEEEILIPPFSNLEVIGKARIEKFDADCVQISNPNGLNSIPVIVIPLR